MPQNALKNALNEVEVHLRESADWFAAAARVTEDPALTTLFDRIRQEQSTLAGRLEHEIRQLGFPRFPDPEKETFDQLASRIKQWLAQDARVALVKDAIQIEQRLLQALADAGQSRPQPAIESLLDEIQTSTEAAQRALQEQITRLTTE